MPDETMTGTDATLTQNAPTAPLEPSAPAPDRVDEAHRTGVFLVGAGESLQRVAELFGRSGQWLDLFRENVAADVEHLVDAYVLGRPGAVLSVPDHWLQPTPAPAPELAPDPSSPILVPGAGVAQATPQRLDPTAAPSADAAELVTLYTSDGTPVQVERSNVNRAIATGFLMPFNPAAPGLVGPHGQQISG